jgi:hypothetical protein
MALRPSGAPGITTTSEHKRDTLGQKTPSACSRAFQGEKLIHLCSGPPSPRSRNPSPLAHEWCDKIALPMPMDKLNASVGRC